MSPHISHKTLVVNKYISCLQGMGEQVWTTH